MPKIDITRTELVWPGKYDEDGNLVPPRRVNLPFQVIERVNETRATREHKVAELRGHYGTLFDYWQAEKAQTTDPNDGWRNKLIWGDNLYVMGSLLEKYAGKSDLIYIDPPFATGADFSFSTLVGEDLELTKDQSILEEKAYRDTWGDGISSYLQMMYERLLLMRDLLSDKGTIYVHLDWRMVDFLRIIMDDIFGTANYLSCIRWKRQTSSGYKGLKKYGRAHDSIICYTKNSDFIFNTEYVPYSESYVKSHYTQVDENGKRYRPHWLGTTTQETIDKYLETGRVVKKSDGTYEKRLYLDEQPGTPVDDVWTDIFPVNSQAIEDTKYATQKSEALLERIIKVSSNSNDLIADFFCGSGTTLAVAEKLNRRWIGCDLGRYGIHITRKRLMDIPDCKPFEILNLGKYERQVWQGVAFDGQKHAQQMLIFEYLKFILELYGAQPLAGTQVLHGKKGSAVVHVGAVDAPVTIDEVISCLNECRQMGQKELHILGWEWEMGLANLMVDEAKGQGIKLLMLTIPREVMEQQAVDKGDIHFYELAYLETDIHAKDSKVTVELTEFVIPNDELIPPDVREKIKKWSDYVDYWAIDWDFQNDSFVNGWTSYRTRKARALQLKSEPHEYSVAGTYRIVVKVIDIFGNDTSQVFEVQI